MEAEEVAWAAVGPQRQVGQVGVAVEAVAQVPKKARGSYCDLDYYEAATEAASYFVTLHWRLWKMDSQLDWWPRGLHDH